MKYDFDKIINRKGTDCLKFDYMVERGLPEDVLSLWVADMDFETAPEILEAIHERVDHGIFGYSKPKDDFKSIVCDWFEKYYGYRYDESWLVTTPGVVFALATAIKAFTNIGDAVIIQQPVYYPFMNMIWKNDRKLIISDLKYDAETLNFSMDLEDFEQKIIDNDVKLFILCNPHNPVGRVWTKDELLAVDEICRRHGVLVVSDEIHCDFTWGDNKHTIYASLSKEAENNCIVCTAPSKSFNLAGLQYSSIFIPNETLRKKFLFEIDKTGYDEPSLFGYIAAGAAYSKGDEWLSAVKEYIHQNALFMDAYLKEKAPTLKMVPLQGTYLAFVDCKELGLDDKEINRRIIEEAKLWLDAGSIFGKAGEGFQRFNLACPRETLTKALESFIKIVY